MIYHTGTRRVTKPSLESSTQIHCAEFRGNLNFLPNSQPFYMSFSNGVDENFQHDFVKY